MYGIRVTPQYAPTVADTSNVVRMLDNRTRLPWYGLHATIGRQAGGRRRRRRRRKLASFMKRIINFQQMIRCKEVLLRKDWSIINLLRVAGLQEDGPVSIKRSSTPKEFKGRSSVGS